MPDHVYKKLEIVGSSPVGFDDAVKNAVAKCGETEKEMRWAEVVETRCNIHEGKIAHWQVVVKIGCRA